MRLAQVKQRLHALQAQQLQRSRHTVVQREGASVTLADARRLLAFCSNDYLGLADDERLQRALCEGAQRYGAGAGASHLISGHMLAHEHLETRLATLLAAHIPLAQALFFCTGYMANLAVISGLALLDDNTEIFSERLNHASLIDGMRLAQKPVHVFAHNDVQMLHDYLEASTAANKIVVTDSVFSMDGDVAQLPELLALCQQFDAWLVVDDAHGFGVLGEGGRGVLAHFDLCDERLIYMGTLGKAAGLSGAFVCAHGDVVNWLVQKSRPYIYTTAAFPALAHALLCSLDIISSEDGLRRRAQLHANIVYLRRQLEAVLRQATLRGHRWRLLASDTAIQPLVVGDNAQALHVARQLSDMGIWVPAIRPPTVPPGTARLRIALSAAHTLAEIDRLVAALDSLLAQDHQP